MAKSHLDCRCLQTTEQNLFRQTLYIFNVDLNIKRNPVVINLLLQTANCRLPTTDAVVTENILKLFYSVIFFSFYFFNGRRQSGWMLKIKLTCSNWHDMVSSYFRASKFSTQLSYWSTFDESWCRTVARVIIDKNDDMFASDFI